MSEAVAETDSAPPAGWEWATLGAGCFWCIEALLRDLKGVESVICGYSGGHATAPSYEDVCRGGTGHTEVVRVTFDPVVIQYADLLRLFFAAHDAAKRYPESADVDTQYRSAIFYHAPTQREVAEAALREAAARNPRPEPLGTIIAPCRNFYAAEEYHQDYFGRNPDHSYCDTVIAVKVRAFREQYAHLLRR